MKTFLTARKFLDDTYYFYGGTYYKQYYSGNDVVYKIIIVPAV